MLNFHNRLRANLVIRLTNSSLEIARVFMFHNKGLYSRQVNVNHVLLFAAVCRKCMSDYTEFVSNSVRLARIESKHLKGLKE